MQTRPSRQATRLGIATLLTFTLVAVACGGNDDDSAAGETDSTASESGDTSAETTTGIVEGEIVEEDVVEDTAVDEVPVQGGTLVYGIEAEVDGLNPTTSAFSSPGYVMGHAVFDNLVRYGADGEPVPFLAESVEAVDGDFSKWQVKVREGITFHDGTPLDGAAVQANFEAQLAAPLVGLAVKPFYPETGATELIDPMTVQFNLLEPNAFFPGALTGQLGMVASPTWLAAAAADPALNQQPVGTGPFVFDSRSPDSVTRMVRNVDWWNSEVYLDAVEFRPVTDPDTRNELLLNGDIQALQTDDEASVIALKEEDGIQNILDETGEEGFQMINSEASAPDASPQNPFSDIRVREALTLATPLETYRNLISLSDVGGGRPANQMFIPESKYFNPDVVQAGDQPDEAVALAGEYCAEFAANCSDGKINMTYTFAGPSVIGTRGAELLKEGWSEAFNVEFAEVPQDDLIQTVALGQYQVVNWRQFGAADPALDNVWLLCRTVGAISLNWPRYCDPARDELLLGAQVETDKTKRVAAYQELSRLLNENFLYIFTTHTMWDNAFAENVRGICADTSPEGVPLICVSNGSSWVDEIWFAE